MVNILYEEIFKKIRIKFLFHHPFLSVLALSNPTLFQTNNKSAFQTNGSQITIDTDKLKNYTEENIVYLYAHTLLHIVLKHPYRKKVRDRSLWNQASDIVVNNILSSFQNIGTVPFDEQLDRDFINNSVEEVYEILSTKKKEQDKNAQNKEKKEIEAQTKENKKGKLKANIYDPSKEDIEEVRDHTTNKGKQEKLDGIIIQALAIANKTTNLSQGLQIEINTLIKPDINFEDILKEYLITSLFEKSTTFNRPNRRFVHRGVYLPGEKRDQESLIVYVALDSSSSVSLQEYKQFLGIISEISTNFYEYKITVLPFDKEVKTDYIISFDSFNPLQEEDLFIPKSDGGTNFDAILRYLKTTTIRADNLLVVLSDGEFEIQETLVCQTLFIINEKKNLDKFTQYGRVLEYGRVI